MKFLPSQLLFFFQNRRARKNVVALSRFFLFIFCIILVYSFTFHQIMLFEGREYSWVTGLYWTLTVMSTLGFGDITFTTDLGLLFSLLVLISGILLLLIILPFAFIQFFYAPWLEAQERSRTPRELTEETCGHVILTSLDPITEKLIDRLKRRHIPYVLLEKELARASELYDLDYSVVLGELDDPKTYRRVRVEQAALVVGTADDLTNTSVAFTVRGVTAKVPMVLSANHENSLDILNFPGNVHVFLYHKILGRRLAERTVGLGRPVNIISQFEELVIAELAASQTRLQGKRLGDIWKQDSGSPGKKAVIIGIWTQGRLQMPLADCLIEERSLLIFAGTMEQIDAFESRYALSEEYEKPVLVLGGGRVGQAVAETLRQQDIPLCVVEKDAEVYKAAAEKREMIVGDAADIAVLEQAGIMSARTAIVTTRNDAMNIYLSFYCRQLRPDIQIVSRATSQRSVARLHMAGADLVLSYASLGANSIINVLRMDEISMFTEGLNLFTFPVPAALIGKTLVESNIRAETGCSVVALRSEKGLRAGPEAGSILRVEHTMVLIGSTEAEQRFLAVFG